MQTIFYVVIVAVNLVLGTIAVLKIIFHAGQLVQEQKGMAVRQDKIEKQLTNHITSIYGQMHAFTTKIDLLEKDVKYIRKNLNNDK